jgi:DNA-binding XRE family transcriptional regulator
MVLQIHDGLQEANDEKFRQINIRIKLYNELKDSNQEQLKQKLRLAKRTIVELERQLELEEKAEKDAILLPSQQIEK